MLLCGIAGCILMAAGDWLMIYGDTAYQGKLAWLTNGAASIEPWKNALAMGLAFPAILLYSVALFGMVVFFKNHVDQKVYCALTAVGMTPWLCLHLFYVMILYLFSWLSVHGQEELAHGAGEALFSQFSWIVIVSEVIMLLPFLYLFYLVLSGKSIFTRWMALNNPLIIFMVLKSLTVLLPDRPFRLALTNGLMSESMILCFLIFLAAVRSAKR